MSAPLIQSLVTSAEDTCKATFDRLTEKVAKAIKQASDEGDFYCTFEMKTIFPDRLERDLRDLGYTVQIHRTGNKREGFVIVAWMK
jgi:hypothetical protein